MVNNEARHEWQLQLMSSSLALAGKDVDGLEFIWMQLDMYYI